jgi:hypothetical protein
MVKSNITKNSNKKSNTNSKNVSSNINATHVLIVIFVVGIIYVLFKFMKRYEGFSNSAKSGLDRTGAVLYINLENREDRKELILKELEKMQVPADKIRKISGVHIPKNGHKGCIQSHILALRMAEMNGWDLTTIIEDDAELLIEPTEFISRLNNALNELEKVEWDVLSFSAANKILNEEESKKYRYVDKLDHVTTSTMYIIRKDYIPKLTKLFEHCNTMMTHNKWGDNDGHEPYALDQKWNELVKKDNWFSLKGDNPITQRNIKSSINSRS